MKLFLSMFLLIAVSTVDIEASIFTGVKHKKDGAVVQGMPGFDGVTQGPDAPSAPPKVFTEGSATDREKFCKAFYCDDIKIEKAGAKPPQLKKK
jgi:hypothetical protein